jgi:hypothetical protein
MGRIPEYQRGKFASSYIGGGQVDTSGQEAVTGLLKGAETVAGVAAKQLEERAQIAVDQQANKAVLEYGLAYQEQAQALQAEYADNPQAYPQAVAEMGMKLMSAYSGGIKDERVNARFGGAANTIIRQSSFAALNWATQKQEQNTLFAARDVMRLSAITTGKSDTFEGFMANIASTHAEIDNLPIPLKEKKEFLEKHGPTMLESHMYNRMQTDRQGLVDDLKSDKSPYEKSPYYSAEMKQKFLSAASTQKERDKKIVREAQENNYFETRDMLYAGTLTTDILDEISMRENPAEQLSQRHMDSLRTKLGTKILTDATALAKNDDDAKSYIEIINLMSDDRADRIRKLEKVLDGFNKGKLLPEEAKQLDEMVRPLSDAKRAREVERVVKNMKGIVGAIPRALEEKKRVGAMAVREFLTQMRGGQDPDETAGKIIQQMQVDAVTEKNPSLKGSKDPIEEGYKQRAATMLKDQFGTYTDAQLSRAIQILKNREGG